MPYAENSSHSLDFAFESINISLSSVIAMDCCPFLLEPGHRAVMRGLREHPALCVGIGRQIKHPTSKHH
jgi:hypothetical protein